MNEWASPDAGKLPSLRPHSQPHSLAGSETVESSFVLQYQNLRVDFDIAIQKFSQASLPSSSRSCLFQAPPFATSNLISMECSTSAFYAGLLHSRQSLSLPRLDNPALHPLCAFTACTLMFESLSTSACSFLYLRSAALAPKPLGCSPMHSLSSQMSGQLRGVSGVII